jgi:hypothetical protein
MNKVNYILIYYLVVKSIFFLQIASFAKSEIRKLNHDNFKSGIIKYIHPIMAVETKRARSITRYSN